MADPTDPTPEQLAALRLAEKPTPSEKEVFEGKIREQAEEIDRLKLELEEIKKPKPEPKKKSFHERFNPLA